MSEFGLCAFGGKKQRNKYFGRASIEGFLLPSYKKRIGFGVGIDGFAAFLQEKARFQVLQKESF